MAGEPLTVDVVDPFDEIATGVGLDSPEIDLREMQSGLDQDADATLALQAAMALPYAKTIVIPAHIYTIQDECQATVDGTYVKGMGSRATWLNFQPAADDLSCLRFTGTPILNEVGVRSLRIQSDAANTRRKFGIRTDVCSVVEIAHVVIGTGSNTFSGGAPIGPFAGASSSGLFLNGWENGIFSDIRISSDIPIRVAPNPNDPNLGLDLTVFEKLTLICLDDGACIYIEPGVVISRCVVRDSNLHPGKYGIYWRDMTAAAASYRLTLENIGFEQANYDGYEVYLESSSKLFSLRAEGISGGGGLVAHSGVFLRNVDEVTLQDIFWGVAPRKFLDVDAASITRIRGTNVNLITGTTVSLGGMIQQEGDGHAVAAAPLPRDFLLVGQDTQFTAGKGHKEGALFQPAPVTGSLANNGDLPLKTFSGGFSQARVVITFKGATKSGSFVAYYDTTGAKMESPVTADVDAGAVVGGKITVAWSSASSVFLANRLGETVTYTVRTNMI